MDDQPRGAIGLVAGLPADGLTHPAVIVAGDEAPPWLVGWGVVECDRPGYPARTEANVRAADGVIWFRDATSPGDRLTLNWCHVAEKPSLMVAPDGSEQAPDEPRSRETRPWFTA